MPGKNARVTVNMLFTFSEKLVSQSSSLQSSKLPLATMPAQLNNASSAGKRAAKACTAAASRTSSTAVWMVAFSWLRLASKVLLMSVAITFAPWAAQANALARPMP